MLVLMGSGETSPTMVEVHKSLVRGRRAVSILDTPYGFQSNADELTERAVRYFRDSIGVATEVVSLRSADASSADIGTGLSRLAAAEYVFAGPGSPTYAARQWLALSVGDVLASILQAGGAVTLASAASVSSGLLTMPVYEMYKVGDMPGWQPGVDLLGAFGLHAAVIPHFNNAEGGTHDTSCCYVGRARLEELRADRPDVPILGIDEHTALLIDVTSGKASVDGLGQAHVLIGDSHEYFDSGKSFDLRTALDATHGGAQARAQAPTESETASVRSALAHATSKRDAAAVIALLTAALPADAAVALTALQSPLESGWGEAESRYQELLLSLRQLARESKLWAVSDLVRDGLADLGFAVEDTPDGQVLRAR